MARKIAKEVENKDEEEKKVKNEDTKKEVTPKKISEKKSKKNKLNLSPEEEAILLKHSVVAIIKDSKEMKKNVKDKQKNAKLSKKAEKELKNTKSTKTSNKRTSETKLLRERKTSTRKRTSKKNLLLDKPTAKPMLAEYYDLPYRYNQTVVKILAQTPTTLFVYWDISDDDRKSLISSHGENFFNETKPVLIVHNITHNYSFEIEINDFANSWYIRTQEPNCDYIIELGRRFYEKNDKQYIYIDKSNNMISPNDHILFEQVDLRKVLFKNLKDNKISYKDFGSLQSIRNMDNLYGNIFDIYSLLYDDETFNEIHNPTSIDFIVKRPVH